MDNITKKKVLCKPIQKNERTVYAYSTSCESICEMASATLTAVAFRVASNQLIRNRL